MPEETPAAKKASAKKTTAKKTTAKKSSAKKSSSSVKLGDTVFVPVDPRNNNTAAEAPATVVNVLDVEGDQRVNLRVFLDGDSEARMTNVRIGKRNEKVEDSAEKVAYTSPKS